jgi:hypothetical protein
MRHRTICPISSDIRRLPDIAARFIGFIAKSCSSAVLQIPIAT